MDGGGLPVFSNAANSAAGQQLIQQSNNQSPSGLQIVPGEESADSANCPKRALLYLQRVQVCQPNSDPNAVYSDPIAALPDARFSRYSPGGQQQQQQQHQQQQAQQQVSFQSGEKLKIKFQKYKETD